MPSEYILKGVFFRYVQEMLLSLYIPEMERRYVNMKADFENNSEECQHSD
jgi:hypothetical protein